MITRTNTIAARPIRLAAPKHYLNQNRVQRTGAQRTERRSRCRSSAVRLVRQQLRAGVSIARLPLQMDQRLQQAAVNGTTVIGHLRRASHTIRNCSVNHNTNKCANARRRRRRHGTCGISFITRHRSGIGAGTLTHTHTHKHVNGARALARTQRNRIKTGLAGGWRQSWDGHDDGGGGGTTVHKRNRRNRHARSARAIDGYAPTSVNNTLIEPRPPNEPFAAL